MQTDKHGCPRKWVQQIGMTWKNLSLEKSKKVLVILDALTFPCNVYDDTLKRISCFRGFSLVLLLRASFCPILDPMREAAKNG